MWFRMSQNEAYSVSSASLDPKSVHQEPFGDLFRKTFSLVNYSVHPVPFVRHSINLVPTGDLIRTHGSFDDSFCTFSFIWLPILWKKLPLLTYSVSPCSIGWLHLVTYSVHLTPLMTFCLPSFIGDLFCTHHLVAFSFY